MWNYWRVEYLAIPSKMQLARFLIGGFEYCMERNPCIQPNGVHLIWEYLRDSLSRQIKAGTCLHGNNYPAHACICLHGNNYQWCLYC